MEGNSVKFVEFGTFESRQRAARKLSHNAIVGGKETVCRGAFNAKQEAKF